MIAILAASCLAVVTIFWGVRHRFWSWVGLGLLFLLMLGTGLDCARELVWSYPWLKGFGGAELWELSVAMNLEQAVVLIAAVLLLLVAIVARGEKSSFAQAPLAGLLGVVLVNCGATPATRALGIFPLLFSAYSGRERGYYVGLAMLLAALGTLLGSFEGHGGNAGFVTLGNLALCLGILGMSQGRTQDEPGTRGMLAYLVPLLGALALIAQAGSGLSQAALDEWLLSLSLAALVIAFVAGFFTRGVFWLNDLGPFAMLIGLTSGRLLVPSLFAILSLGVVRGIGGVTRPVSAAEGDPDRLRRRLGWGVFFFAHYMVLGGVGSALHGNVALLAEQVDVNRQIYFFLAGYVILVLGSARVAARIYRQAHGRAFGWRQTALLASVAVAQLAIFWSGRWVGGLDSAQVWQNSWGATLAPWGSDEGQPIRVFAPPVVAMLTFAAAYFWTLRKEEATATRPAAALAAKRAAWSDRAHGAVKQIAERRDRVAFVFKGGSARARWALSRRLEWVRDREALATALMLWAFCVACAAWVMRGAG